MARALCCPRGEGHSTKIAVPFTVLMFGTVTLLLTSSMTHIGPWFYKCLEEPALGVPGELVKQWVFLLGIVLAAIAYLVDLLDWRPVFRCFVIIYCTCTALSFWLGLLFLTRQIPSMPLFCGTVNLILCLIFLRTCLFQHVPTEVYAWCSSAALLSTSGLFVLAWILWLNHPKGIEEQLPVEMSPAFGDEVEDQLLGRTSLSSETRFVLWCSPALLAFAYGLIGLLMWMRGRFQVQQCSIAGSDVRVGSEVQVCVVLLGITAFGMWIAASLAAEDVDLSKFVMRVSAFTFCGIIFYIAYWIGTARILDMSRHNSTLQMVVAFILSDWAKGIVVLLCLPLLPLLLCAESMHQCTRRCLRRLGILREEDVDKEWLTVEARRTMDSIRNWEAASVLTKATIVGIAICSFQVGVSQGLIIFLAWFNEQMEAWSFGAVLGVLFVVEILLFLFPPVAGPPLYMLAAIVIIPKVGFDGGQFYMGVFAATLFCLVLKMTAIALEQKVIGANMANNVPVKKFIGVHTSGMKAIRYILSQPGLDMKKVSILVGGPDWPTSVTTGILELPLGSMLLGSAPVAFLILPCCFSAGYLLQSGRQPERRAQLKALADVCLALAGLATGIANMMAVYNIQVIVKAFEAELSVTGSDWQRDPQEAEVLAAVAVDVRLARLRDASTCWRVLPGCLRVFVITGTVLATISVYILINPVAPPFIKFSISQKVSDLPGGNALAVVNQPGWLAIAVMCGSIICLCVFQFWCYFAVRRQVRYSVSAQSVIDSKQQDQMSQGPWVSDQTRRISDIAGPDCCVRSHGVQLPVASDRVPRWLSTCPSDKVEVCHAPQAELDGTIFGCCLCCAKEPPAPIHLQHAGNSRVQRYRL